MCPRTGCQEIPVGSRITPLGATLILMCLSIALFSTVDAHAQATYTQGLPTVGTGPGTAVPGQMTIDAVQFLNPPTVPDMCAAIAVACSKLGTPAMSPVYPLGATIDARGFTGIQVCQAGNITTMLSGCVGGSGHNGGKLLLGNVNLYADGPTAHAYYTDGTSTVGTPALIIPAQFWGIEGISRGSAESSSTSAAPGTFLSVCTGPNTPVSGCTTAFPQRSLSPRPRFRLRAEPLP